MPRVLERYARGFRETKTLIRHPKVAGSLLRQPASVSISLDLLTARTRYTFAVRMDSAARQSPHPSDRSYAASIGGFLFVTAGVAGFSRPKIGQCRKIVLGTDHSRCCLSERVARQASTSRRRSMIFRTRSPAVPGHEVTRERLASGAPPLAEQRGCSPL